MAARCKTDQIRCRLEGAKRVRTHIQPYINGFEGIALREALDDYIEKKEAEQAEAKAPKPPQ